MMKRKTKILILISSICFVLLIILFLFYFSINILKEYITKELFVGVEDIVHDSQVLSNEIGEIESVEFQFFPVFKYKYSYYVYDAELTYKVTTKNDKEYIVKVFVNSNEASFKYVYAYQIDDKIIYETMTIFDKMTIYDKIF